MSSRSNTGQERLQHESMTSPSGTLTHSIPTPGVSGPNPTQEQEQEQNIAPGIEAQSEPFSDPAMHGNENENKEVVITSIRATGVSLGLRRVPAGFYTVVHHSSLDWRTENKPSSVNYDVVEWTGPIPIPSTPSATVRLGVYASFEFQPMLGAGEQLRELTVTVERLLDSAKDLPFTFLPKDEDVVSPCSSILVTIKRQNCESRDPSASSALGPYCSTTEYRGELEDATNRGHSALSHYRKHGRKRDLEHSIEQFERALCICLLDHPCHAAAQSNLAMAKSILCQIEGTDTLLPLSLYRNALGVRPVGHADRPSTLIQLAAVHFVRLEKLRDEVEGALAEGLLHEAMELSSAESHEHRAATFMLQLHAGRRVGSVKPDGQSLVEQDSTSHLTDEDPRILSVRLLERFERFGDLADLQQAIANLKELVRSTSVQDDRYNTYLWVALMHRFRRLGELSDLGDAISTIKDAVDLTPHDHPDKPSRLNNLSNSFIIRFQRLGELSDLEDAISTLRDAVDLTPAGHPDEPGRLHNLGNCFRARFDRLGQPSDLEEAISRQKDAVYLAPHGHPYNPIWLNSLGNSFLTRFKRLGRPSDLEDAISTLRNAVDLTPHDHPHKPHQLKNLGNSFLTRFECLGQLSDLGDAISALRNAVDLTPHGHRHKPGCLNNLGSSFFARFQRFGELSDLEEAISTLSDAVDLSSDDHPSKPACLGNLGNYFRARFERLGELGDLEKAISMLRVAVDLIPGGHLDKPACLNSLGDSFRTRFERFGQLGDLEEAISRQNDAVHLTPHGHPGKLGRLSSLSNSLFIRFECLGELSDLEKAVSMLKDAVNLAPHGHPHKPACLDALGNCFRTRFERLGQLNDLEEAISRQKDAVYLTPHGHPHKPSLLNNLGNSFLIRFKHLGELNDLKEAISACRDAVDFTPHDHSHKPTCLNNLGNTFIIRFERLGELSDLEDAISTLRDAVDLAPHGHPLQPTCLNNLGNCFRTRFERLRQLSDLEGAISRQKDAVYLTPHGHPHKPGLLNSLGVSFRTRFDHLGELSDLEEAILMFRDAVYLTPHGHPDKPTSLNNLGNSLFIRFERFNGELSDLEKAISILRDAIDLAPHDHPLKPTCLDNLGSCFGIRFERLGQLDDLEEAISRQKDAVYLTPHGHPDKPGLLNSLGISFRTRFEHLGELSDLEGAISTLGDAVYLTPHGHPDKPTCLYNFGNCFRTRFERLGQLSDLEDAISLYLFAASAPLGPTEVRFHASQKWISCARRIDHHSLFHAYSVSINLLPQLAWIGLSLTHRYSNLTLGADVVREAAAAALDSGLLETTVEWLERGRSIVWGELFQLRSSYEELSSAHPNHARRLRDLSAALDHASATRERSLSALSELAQSAADRASESLKQQVDRHRALAIERDKLLQEIRRLPGFDRFLLHKQFSQLRASAHTGPVVILNAAESRCDALIVLADVDHVIHVPLTAFPLKRLAGLQHTLKGFIRHAREGKSVVWDGVSWESFLSPLWKCVVKPVLDALAISIPGDLTRIFWCPTGPFTFLPVHAAGFYDAEHSQPGHKVFDFVVSSYVPTLAILAPSPNPAVAPSDNLRLLVVRQPPSDGLPQLPGVVTELEHIRRVIKNSPSACTTLLESSDGTVEEVLALMKEADWVHFACHGIQDHVDSGLCLADQRRLKLRDIIALSRSRGGLAFLSACQTAMGNEHLSDEAIHIAAGMLFAGYRGVIGTMWSISDSLAPVVARDVYEHLFWNNARPDYREAARALHEAIGSVRDSATVSFNDWVPFIHVGL